MEELDKLKQDWKKNENNFPKFSETEIYRMLHKKSSSIVKWILIISILEFLFQLSLSYILKDSPSAKQFDSYNIDYILTPLTILSYAIIVYFSYLFYMNYRKISATDSIKNLMANILKTRKTVSAYIYVNLSYIVISSIVVFYEYFRHDQKMIALFNKSDESGKQLVIYGVTILLVLVTIGLFVLIVWLFYRLIYGLLLKRLHRNYEELKKIDF